LGEFPKTELDPKFPKLFVVAPPAPTVTVYEVPAVTEKLVPVLKPPAPPPPQPIFPPPWFPPPDPPPATTKYSTSVTPAGQTHVVEEVNVWMTV
jgi:hypothetical protein